MFIPATKATHVRGDHYMVDATDLDKPVTATPSQAFGTIVLFGECPDSNMILKRFEYDGLGALIAYHYKQVDGDITLTIFND